MVSLGLFSGYKIKSILYKRLYGASAPAVFFPVIKGLNKSPKCYNFVMMLVVFSIFSNSLVEYK
jgi:hypothetical protein